MWRRGSAAVLVVAAMGLGAGCRADTVDLGFRPDPGDRYRYRYEIEAVVTRAIEGGPAEVSEIDSELLVEQVVRSADDDGARVEVEVRRDGGAPRAAVVILDRAGSLQGIELLEGLAASELGAPEAAALLGAGALAPPTRPLAPGERWSAGGDGLSGTGRLERLGVIDGEDVAVVRTELTESVESPAQPSDGAAVVGGSRSAEVTSSHDLDDGAIRRSESSAVGELIALIAPPPGVDAEPVEATIAYEVRVRVTRLR